MRDQQNAEEISMKKKKRGDEIKRQEAEHSFYYPICLLVSWNVSLFLLPVCLLAVGGCFCLFALALRNTAKVRPSPPHTRHDRKCISLRWTVPESQTSQRFSEK
jgi:hypothetical protein